MFDSERQGSQKAIYIGGVRQKLQSQHFLKARIKIWNDIYNMTHLNINAQNATAGA